MQRILSVCFTLQCSRRMERAGCVVPQLWKGCRGTERHAELPECSTFTRPGVYEAVAPGSTHTPRTQMLDVSSVFKKRALTCVHTCTLRSTPGPGLATGERCHTLDTLWQDQQLPESSWGKRGTIFCLFMLSCPKQHWNKIQSFNTATNCPHNVITTFSEVFTQSLMNFAVMPKRKRAYMQPCRQRENKTIRPHLRMVTNIWNGQSSNQRA